MTQNKVYTISILGCGWFGTALAKKLIDGGYKINGSTTTSDKLHHLKAQGIIPYLINIDGQTNTSGDAAIRDFMRCDVVIVSIPPRRNSTEKHSFLNKIRQISQVLSLYKVEEVIFISSTAVYGDHNSEVDETSATMPDTDSGKILLEAETHLRQLSDVRSTIIRFGGLIGPNRHPGRFLAGKKDVANGLAPVNLIHLTDCTCIVNEIVNQRAFGYIFNGVAPSHPSRQTFYTRAAKNSKLQEPQFIPEITHWKKVNSVYLQSVLGYSFELPHWEDWI